MERTRVELRWFGRELIRVGTEWIREEEEPRRVKPKWKGVEWRRDGVERKRNELLR